MSGPTCGCVMQALALEDKDVLSCRAVRYRRASENARRGAEWTSRLDPRRPHRRTQAPRARGNGRPRRYLWHRAIAENSRPECGRHRLPVSTMRVLGTLPIRACDAARFILGHPNIGLCAIVESLASNRPSSARRRADRADCFSDVLDLIARERPDAAQAGSGWAFVTRQSVSCMMPAKRPSSPGASTTQQMWTSSNQCAAGFVPLNPTTAPPASDT
jgi:hypothetical protein